MTTENKEIKRILTRLAITEGILVVVAITLVVLAYQFNPGVVS